MNTKTFDYPNILAPDEDLVPGNLVYCGSMPGVYEVLAINLPYVQIRKVHQPDEWLTPEFWTKKTALHIDRQLASVNLTIMLSQFPIEYVYPQMARLMPDSNDQLLYAKKISKISAPLLEMIKNIT